MVASDGSRERATREESRGSREGRRRERLIEKKPFRACVVVRARKDERFEQKDFPSTEFPNRVVTRVEAPAG